VTVDSHSLTVDRHFLTADRRSLTVDRHFLTVDRRFLTVSGYSMTEHSNPYPTYPKKLPEILPLLGNISELSCV
jgi:hypothetical protein